MTDYKVDLPLFDTIHGKLRPAATKHFLERHQERFPGIPISDLSSHIARTMTSSVVIYGLPGSKPDDYMLWHAGTDRILIMVGYMGWLVTCYPASTSGWFIESKCADHSWPTFASVFGRLVDPLAHKSPGQRAKVEKQLQKRAEAQHDSYLQWYEKSKGG